MEQEEMINTNSTGILDSMPSGLNEEFYKALDENDGAKAHRLFKQSWYMDHHSTNKETKIYEFIYNDCIYEGGWVTMSIHRTKKGAYKAMRRFLIDSYMDWYNERMFYGKGGYFGGIDKFGRHSGWGVREVVLND